MKDSVTTKDLSLEMQIGCHNVSTKAAMFIRDQIIEMFGGEPIKPENDPLAKGLIK